MTALALDYLFYHSLKGELSAFSALEHGNAQAFIDLVKKSHCIQRFGQALISAFVCESSAPVTSHDILIDRRALLYYLMLEEGKQGLREALQVPYSPENHIHNMMMSMMREDMEVARLAGLRRPSILGVLAELGMQSKMFTLNDLLSFYDVDVVKEVYATDQDLFKTISLVDYLDRDRYAELSFEKGIITTKAPTWPKALKLLDNYIAVSTCIAPEDRLPFLQEKLNERWPGAPANPKLSKDFISLYAGHFAEDCSSGFSLMLLLDHDFQLISVGRYLSDVLNTHRAILSQNMGSLRLSVEDKQHIAQLCLDGCYTRSALAFLDIEATINHLQLSNDFEL